MWFICSFLWLHKVFWIVYRWRRSFAEHLAKRGIGIVELNADEGLQIYIACGCAKLCKAVQSTLILYERCPTECRGATRKVKLESNRTLTLFANSQGETENARISIEKKFDKKHVFCGSTNLQKLCLVWVKFQPILGHPWLHSQSALLQSLQCCWWHFLVLRLM